MVRSQSVKLIVMRLETDFFLSVYFSSCLSYKTSFQYISIDLAIDLSSISVPCKVLLKVIHLALRLSTPRDTRLPADRVGDRGVPGLVPPRLGGEDDLLMQEGWMDWSEGGLVVLHTLHIL